MIVPLQLEKKLELVAVAHLHLVLLVLLVSRTEVQLVPFRQAPIKGLQGLPKHHIVPTAMLHKCKWSIENVGTRSILEQTRIS